MTIPKRIEIEQLRPPSIITKNRIKYVKVYFSITEYTKVKELANKEHLKLSPYIRKKSLQEYLISTHNLSDPIERITRKDIEKKLVVDSYGKIKAEILAELKQGIKLQPIGSFDAEIIFIEEAES